MRRKNHYSCSEFIKTAYSVILTRIIYPQCRIIRRPVYIRGRKSIVGAKGVSIGRLSRFDLDGKKQTLFIGDNCEFGDYTHIVALKKVSIGNNVLVASKVFISDCSHGYYGDDENYIIDKPDSKPNDRKLFYKSVYIGDNVWIGENVVILAGAYIGNGCIIGANSVITKNIPDNSIVVGNNKIIKKYNCTSGKWERFNESITN